MRNVSSPFKKQVWSFVLREGASDLVGWPGGMS